MMLSSMPECARDTRVVPGYRLAIGSAGLGPVGSEITRQ